MSKLFYDDEFEALRAVIEGSDFTYKQVAAHLFPAMKPDSAYAKLKACTQAAGDERLKFGEIVAMCRFCRRFDALFYMADELDHDRPTERTPENQQELLLGEIHERLVELDGLKKALDRVSRSRK